MIGYCRNKEDFFTPEKRSRKRHNHKGRKSDCNITATKTNGDNENMLKNKENNKEGSKFGNHEIR